MNDVALAMLRSRGMWRPRARACRFRSGLAAVLVALGAPTAVRANEVLASTALQAALTAAVTVRQGRVDVVALDRPAGDCATDGPRGRAEASRPIEGSGRVAVKLAGFRPAGDACEVWAWVRVRVYAPVPVAARAIRAGEPVANAARIEEREIKPGHVPAMLTDDSTSDRALGAGQMIEVSAIRPAGPGAGQAVRVVLVSGALAIEQTGRAVSCGRGAFCAVLPSGKHVEGTFADGRLLVQLP